MTDKLQELLNNVENSFKALQEYSELTQIPIYVTIPSGNELSFYPKPKPKIEEITRKQAIEELASAGHLSLERMLILRKVLSATSEITDVYANEWVNSSEEYEEYGWMTSSQKC